MKMPASGPLKNLRGAKAARALVLLSIFLPSVGPALAAGAVPARTPTPSSFNATIPSSINGGIYSLKYKFSEDPAPMKAVRPDHELQSHGKDKDTFIHEEPVEHGIPYRNNKCESSSGDFLGHSQFTTKFQLNSEHSACKNRNPGG
jgi:hypothetical protein